MSIPAEQWPGPSDMTTTFLRLAAKQHANTLRAHKSSERNRDYFASLARAHGLTHQKIANEYGITESAVRAMLKRNGG